MEASARAGRRLTATSITDDAGHLGFALDCRSCRLRRSREPHRHAVGIGDAIVAAERGGDHTRGIEPGREPRRLRSLEPVDVDSEAALQRDVAAEDVDTCLRGEKKEIAVLME